MNKNKIVGLCSDQNELHTQVAQTGLSNAALWLQQREELQQTSQNPEKTAGTSTGKSSKKDDNYTDPALRERLKEEIKAGEKGGKEGQWSARKAQLLTHEYEKEGGGYKEDKKTESQKQLTEWTDQDWKTADGKPADRE
ncbi:MAG TPA: hypothetical protein VGB67_16790, partial [Fibrella sp.]